MKRSWFQFRLKTLFLLLTLAAIATGVVVRHARFVEERIRYHEARLMNCETRITQREDPEWLSARVRAARAESDSLLPEGHLLYDESPFGSELFKVMQVRNREIEQLDEAKAYHQGQIHKYRQSLWRPWVRIAETQEEPPELPPEVSPEAPESLAEQPMTFEPIAPPYQPADEESHQPSVDPIIRSPWQSIDRPLPYDFDNRDVQVERASAA
jgi:hypothetical protein